MMPDMLGGGFGGFGKIADFAKFSRLVSNSFAWTLARLGDLFLGRAGHPHIEDALVACQSTTSGSSKRRHPAPSYAMALAEYLGLFVSDAGRVGWAGEGAAAWRARRGAAAGAAARRSFGAAFWRGPFPCQGAISGLATERHTEQRCR